MAILSACGFCSDLAKTNWESAIVTTLDDKILPYITNICKRDPRIGKVVTEEWLYHLGVPVEEVLELAEKSAFCWA